MEETLEIRMACGASSHSQMPNKLIIMSRPRHAKRMNQYHSIISSTIFWVLSAKLLLRSGGRMKSYIVGSYSACRIARDKLDIHADGSEQIQPLGSEFRSCQLSTK
jgi:hypothetical protein